MNSEEYMSSCRKQFEYYKYLGSQTFQQLEEKDFFWQLNDESNSIAVIVKHLHGNMMSRWTDFLTSDGEKEWRNRDGEFVGDLNTRAEILDLWEEGWGQLFKALASINQDNFSTTIYIRNQGHSIMEAINRQLCHYAYHVGQMVFIGRMIKGPSWHSLSIPKGASASYNAQMFEREKKREHFTDQFVDHLRKRK